MKKIYNITLYFLYKLDYRFHLAFNRINIIYYLNKLPYLKKKYKSKGVNDINIEVNKAFERADFGISSMRAGGFMLGLVGLFFFSFYNFYTGIIKHQPQINIYVFIFLCLAIAYTVDYFLSQKNKQYLKYFKTFKKWDRKKKWLNVGLSLCFILSIIAFVIVSFWFMGYRINS